MLSGLLLIFVKLPQSKPIPYWIKRRGSNMTFNIDLENIPFFRQIPASLLHSLTQYFELKELRNEAVIISYGQDVDSIYLIVSGAVNILTPDGDEVITTLGAGDAVGEASLFVTQQKATAHVKVGSKGATVVIMPKKIIEEKILKDHKLASYFYKGMCAVMAERLKLTNRTLSEKIRELKTKLKNLLEDSHLLSKIKGTQSHVENLGSEIFSSLAEITTVLDNGQCHSDIQDPIIKAKQAVEKVLLHDLQDIDRIAQKLGMAIQYLENIERTINNQEILEIRGDKNIFQR